MGRDFYMILGVPRDAKDEDIKAAYRKKALKLHPDRHASKSDAEKEQLTEQFKAVSEAYDVLSDPEKRQIYDQFGEDGLKGGVPGAGGSAGPGGGTYHFSGTDAEEIFRQFFGPGFSFGGGGGSSNGFDDFGGGFGSFGNFGMGNGMGGMGGGRRVRQAKPPAATRMLPCTLEELYTGKRKKLRVTRTLYDASGKSMQVEKILEIDVKPGWKNGTKITFSDEGDEPYPGGQASDIIFVVQQKDHPIFTREGDNLIVNSRITLKEALCGTHVMVNTLSGRHLKVNVRDIVHPHYIKRIAGEGMPNQKNPTQKGDLLIKFDVQWPSSLTDEQKEKLKSVL